MTEEKKIKLTEEQESIVFHVASSKSNLVVNAVAGSGKSTVLGFAAKAWKRNFPSADGLAVAFNKEIAKTLKEKMPSNFECRTLHSHGLTAWKRYYGSDVVLEKFKDYQCLETATGDLWLEEEVQAIKQELRRGLSIIKSAVITEDLLLNYEAELREHLQKALDHQAIFFSNEEEEEFAHDIIIAALKESIRLAEREGVISFDDMLFMPIYVEAEFDQFDLVLLDEAQDVSALQLEMVSRSIRSPLGKLIAVGDRNQAIYGWRGADDRSIDRIKNRFECDELPMTFTFRCPQAVVMEAQKVVPHIRCPEDTRFGEVNRIDVKELLSHLDTISPEDLGDFAIVCRNRKPLIDLAFSLRARNIKAFVLGSEIAHILTAMVRGWKVYNALDVERKAQKWMEEESVKARRKGAWDALSQIEDRGHCLISICKNLDAGLNKREIIAEIKEIFADERKDPKSLLLSTIHKAKGLEWQHVLFLYPELLPNKYCQLDWQFQQEANLRYVATTRALEQLIIASERKEEENETTYG